MLNHFFRPISLPFICCITFTFYFPSFHYMLNHFYVFPLPFIILFLQLTSHLCDIFSLLPVDSDRGRCGGSGQEVVEASAVYDAGRWVSQFVLNLSTV